jgi:hypothetical protein
MRSLGGVQLRSRSRQLALNEDAGGLTTVTRHGPVSLPDVGDGSSSGEGPTMPVREACLRCGGRMLPSGMDGDLGCFSCGNQTYAQAAEIDVRARRRATSHGHQRLD